MHFAWRVNSRLPGRMNEQHKRKPIKTILARTPIRVNDIGGWTDTWFAGEGKVLNTAVSPIIEVKIEALRAHKSQMKDWDPAPRIKEWAAERAKGKEMAFAEGFRVITLESDEDWEKKKGHIFPPDES